ncbi:hypothetical protein QBC33DRAFT_210480 [Phialemonium atrogriseum]|uniref:Uncharacterized protein n=1 Tax=Phialemonium atrogriseum TaxID=1093897 RepID=A0AAJ0FI22_9PEZI|nr:uncharacterized protein QBC33DRAFT_210480 [Phialemonium atrogriseum]KAK1763933.1 hypothetical protein QBC33DRAFT_210480 [Phialemonium atrogriseum]
MADYNSATSKTWDICNESTNRRHSGKPAPYKLVSREVPGLLRRMGRWMEVGRVFETCRAYDQM